MFGKFKEKFGQLDSEEKKLLGECILYILLLDALQTPQGTQM